MQCAGTRIMLLDTQNLCSLERDKPSVVGIDHDGCADPSKSIATSQSHPAMQIFRPPECQVQTRECAARGNQLSTNKLIHVNKPR